MTRYIAFLRGINISGKNKIAMPELKQAFEVGGFTEVKTYINSGNVVFSSELLDRQELITLIEAIIEKRFNLCIPVAIVTADELRAVVSHAPKWWGTDNKEIYHNAIFIIPPANAEQIFAAVGEAKPEYETVDHYDQVIYWSATLKTFSKARWSKIANTSANNKVTIRTANTVKKLLQLL